MRHLLRPSGKRARSARSRGGRPADKLLAAGFLVVAFRIGDAWPLQTVDNEMSERSGYAGILLSRLPHGLSRMAAGGLPGKLRRRHGLPVEHVIAALILMDPRRRRT